MAEFEHILVPIDFSDASRKALRYGLSLALEMEARLTVAHVMPFSPALAYVYPIEGNQVPDEEIAGVREKLLDLVPGAYREAVRVTSVVKVGDVRDELLGLIAGESPDLVVMGTHGHRRFQRWLLGSVTEAILRRASVPLLTVSRLDEEHDLDRPMPVPLGRILYATDLSPESVPAMERALGLAHAFSAELIVLHVVQDPGWAFASEFLPLDTESRTVQAREAAFEYLVGSVPEEARKDPKVRIELLEGVPFEVIQAFAASEDADLIVLNTRTRSGVDRVLLGSTAERVVRGAAVPVLSLPPRKG